MKNRKKSIDNKKILVIAGAVAGAALLAVGIFFGIRGIKNILSINDISGALEIGGLTEEDYKKHPYLRDVWYTGPVKYMELFDYKFGKTDYYIMNKELDPKIYNTSAYADTATEFIKKLYTVDYRDLANSTKEYKDKISEYIDPEIESNFFSDAGPVIGQEDGLDYFIEQLATEYVENEKSSKAEFITDAELVYEDGYMFCRGIIEYEEFGANAGEMKCYPVEIAMKRNAEGDHPYVTCIFPLLDQDTRAEFKEFDADTYVVED